MPYLSNANKLNSVSSSMFYSYTYDGPMNYS